MKRNNIVILLTGVLGCAALCLWLMHCVGKVDNLQSKEVAFFYARFPEPERDAEKGKRHRYEYSLRSMREMLDVLKREDFIRKVVCAVMSSSLNCEHSVPMGKLLEDVRGVEFMLDEYPDESNRVKGRMTVRTSSGKISRAIAGAYVALLRQLVADEVQERIDKSTMSYYSDYHLKRKELMSLEGRLLLKGAGDADRQSIRQNVLRVKDEMARIDADWKRRIEELRKESGGAIEFREIVQGGEVPMVDAGCCD